MVNIVGKFRWMAPLVMLMSVVVHAVPVELKVMALDGAPLESAGVGVPFLVEVKADGREPNQKPRIAGLEAFQVQQAGVRVYSVNGQVASTFTYKVRIDKTGTFVIGPAELYINGMQAQSKAVRITVTDTQIIDQAYIKKVRADMQDASVQLSVDKTEVFVGERVKITLSFTGKRDKVELAHVEEPALSEFYKGTKIGPVAESRIINNVEYHVISWTWEVYAKKAGQLVIPACSADYRVASEMTGSMAMFSPFFRTRIENKRTYSNAFVLYVRELPAFQGPVDAVGNFTQFDASINPTVAQEGEGLVLRFELEGDGDFARVPSLQLQHMPQALKWYDSKQYIRDGLGAHGYPVKCFEFIVQGLEQGMFEIPPQSFTYFDVRTKQYVTLKTVPCSVTIKYNPAMAKRGTTEQQADAAMSAAVDFKDGKKLQLNTWSSLRPVAARKPMPWWLFCILACIPLFWGLLRCVRIIVRSRAAVFQQHFAFKQARKKIKDAQRQLLVRNLHTIFIELFALRLQCAPSLISQEIIEAALRRVGISDKEMLEWQEFYMHMYECAFFIHEATAVDKDALFEQALSWVSRLEKLL